jgi:hypothetical protein
MLYWPLSPKFKNMKIFLDDIRDPPDDTWVTYRRAEDLIADIFVNWEKIEAISFDNDLGDDNMEGYRVLNYIEQMVMDASYGKQHHLPDLHIHSANPVARARMAVVIWRLQNIS